ncbi:HTH_Tnp_Tc3_2 domain-containing protein [Trichonephila clavipes]|nr:HTH_Tnp_Tc3_2 domain-containing protein [Trichonephila clavipes]
MDNERHSLPSWRVGASRNTNARDDRAIVRLATSSPTMLLELVRCQLPISRHPVASRESIRRRLSDAGIRRRRPLRRLQLVTYHRLCQ